MPTTARTSRSRRFIGAIRAMNRRNSDEWIQRLEAPSRRQELLYRPDRLR